LINKKLIATAVVIFVLLASTILAAGGELRNQTSVSNEFSGGSLLTLSPSNSSRSFVESATFEGLANLVPNGSAVIITPSSNLPDEGYYPKRTFVSYDLTARAGTLYTVFLYTKYDGRAFLFGGNEAFTHSPSSSSIATYVDYVNGESYNSTEPLLSLSSILTDGQIALIFVPLYSSPTNASSFNSLRVETVQTTWGLLPFGTSGLLNQAVPSADMTAAVSYMLSLGTFFPVLISVLLWRRLKGGWMSPRTTTILLVAAAAIRFALAPVTGFIDTDNFAATASTYYGSGVFGIDWVSLPGFVYIELVSYLPYALLRTVGFGDWTVLAHSTFAVETVFVKIPSILSDIGIGLLLAKFAERHNPDLKGVVLALYLFNPLTIYLSAVYGQFDPVFVFLLLASLYSHFILRRPFLTGLLLGATSLVNPVGFILWIALFAFGTKSRDLKRIPTIYATGTITFLAGLAPILSQSNSVLQTTLERLVSAFPGDSVVGTIYNFTALGQLHSSSVGYGLTFRQLLELLGYSAGYYFYPAAAAAVFLGYATLMTWMNRRGVTTGTLSSLTFCLGSVALFNFFFPLITLQFAVWPFALLLCTYAIAGERRYLTLASSISLVTGILYVVLVDKPFDRAAGAGLELFSDPRIANSVWAMTGLVYSVLMLCIVALSISVARHATDVTTSE
jgi:hypothetical protein